MSIPSINRIAQKESFSKAFKAGNTLSIDGFKIHAAKQDNLTYGVVIPKKLVKLSVDRHRLKRRLYSCIQEEQLHNCMLVVQVTKKLSSEYNLDGLKSALQNLSIK